VSRSSLATASIELRIEYAGRYFTVSKEEAIDIFGNRYEELWSEFVGGYTAGYDHFVFT
jgi:hypothetical protein